VIRVLVVDDSVSFLAAATEVVLAADGFELAGVAQTGEEGIELARVSRPELALIDLNMPGIDGEETAERLAMVSPETAILLMTATPARRTNGVLDKRGLSPAALAEIWGRIQTPSERRPTEASSPPHDR
jgi:DNA-binding response OmpR family regulator